MRGSRQSGGVRSPKSVDETGQGPKRCSHATNHASDGPEGKGVQRTRRRDLPIDRELYLGIVIDLRHRQAFFMASGFGGMEIEEVAAKDPNAILKVFIEPPGTRAVSGGSWLSSSASKPEC